MKTQEAKLKPIIYTDRGMETRVRKEEKLNPCEDKDPDWKHLEWGPKSQWREREMGPRMARDPAQRSLSEKRRGEREEGTQLRPSCAYGTTNKQRVREIQWFSERWVFSWDSKASTESGCLVSAGRLNRGKGHVRKRPCCLLTYNSRAESMGWNIRLKEITQVRRGASTQHLLTH